MALFVVAPLARITRPRCWLAGSDFVRTARSVGLPWWRVVVTMHAQRHPPLHHRSIVFSTMLALCSGGEGFSWPASPPTRSMRSLSDYAPVRVLLLMATVL